MPNVKTIPLDELPIHSKWISYLLGLDVLDKSFLKNTENIQREFGVEKWGGLLSKLTAQERPNVFIADKFDQNTSCSEVDIPFFFGGKFLTADLQSIRDIGFNLIAQEIEKNFYSGQSIIELGAGYGSIILKIAMLKSFKNSFLYGGEFTEAGVKCLELLSKDAPNFKLAFQCDLNDLKLTELQLPENAIFFTSWTMAYLKGFPRRSILEIIRRNPKLVLHFEPIYQHWHSNSLTHLLWRRYLKINNYNCSFLESLIEYEKEGLIDILEQRPNIFGYQPLAPISVIKWAPRR